MQLANLMQMLYSQPLRKKKMILLLFVIILVYVMIALAWKYESHTLISKPKRDPGSQSMLLLWWWADLTDDYEVTSYCGRYECTFTRDRQKLASAKAILFHGSFMEIAGYPLPRMPHHIWALLQEYFSDQVLFITHEFILQHFNFTSTFSRYSDSPLTTMFLPRAEQLTSLDYLMPVAEKTALQKSENLAPIAYVESDCRSISGREKYINVLKRYINVDSYGTCLPNDMARNLNSYNDSYNIDLYIKLARYKFVIGYENIIAYDHITEKFWRPLIIGSIPVYFGSPSIKDWEPNPKSVIYINDFRSVEELSDFIRTVDANDTKYNSYLKHKYDRVEPITNERLKRELFTREYSVGNKNFYGAFECFLCRRLHEMDPNRTYMATGKHYEYPLSPSYPPLGSGRYFDDGLQVNKMPASVQDRLLRRNVNYTMRDFTDLFKREYAKSCEHHHH